MCSFFRLYNFVCNHIKDFAILVAPLFKLTRQESGYSLDLLPDAALWAFQQLQLQLTSKLILAFPRSDRQYILITDATISTLEKPGGHGAILA